MTEIADKIETVLFQLTQFYDAQLKEKESETQAQALMTETVTQLHQEVNRFATLEEAVIVHLRKMLQTTEENVSASISKLDDKAIAEKNIPIQNQEKRRLQKLKITAITIITTAIVTFSATILLMPTSPAPLTEAQKAFIASGEMIAKIWPKLTKNEQQRLLGMIEKDE